MIHCVWPMEDGEGERRAWNRDCRSRAGLVPEHEVIATNNRLSVSRLLLATR